ncbi:MAG: thioredoxin domain-containing protein [Bacteroidota bacterium]
MPDNHKYTNNLIHETSPYLLQHAHNPVNWHAWNDETLEIAKKEKKLLLISIGYAACHWCHVMERESFEDSTVAKIMNKHFINIKVDREERPDVDQIYMNAIQLLTGSGGWPLNSITLPDGRPVWSGTYFPKTKWINVLKQIADLYQKDPGKMEEYANNLTKGIQQSGLIKFNREKAIFTKNELVASVKKWQQAMDFDKGGRIGAPKFPMPGNINFLLRYAKQSNDKIILNYVNTSLRNMAMGGIYDQIGGGFARYSVDNRWHIPHFEKMLYDNAQLVSLYANAYKTTKEPLYKEIVYDTTQFIERELYNEEGFFYSSLDADSESSEGNLKEGAYYIWTRKELENILGKDFHLFAEYFNVNPNGKFENNNYHLFITYSKKDFAEKNDLPVDELENKIQYWKKTLRKEREKRPLPGLDDKTLTSWNALMLKGYIDAYSAFNDVHFLKIALKNAHFITHRLIKKEGGLFRNYKNGKGSINAYLIDYATVIDAFISLYEVTFDENWLLNAKQFTDYCFDHFYDDKSKMFYFTSNKSTDLITRKTEVDDNVIPSSNSIMANNLFRLSHYFSNKHYAKTTEIMLNNVKESILNYAAGASNWLHLYSNYLGNFYEITISGEDVLKKSQEINQYYIPNKLLAGSTKKSDLPLLQHKSTSDDTKIYVCVNGACKLPVNEIEEALKQIKINF